MLDLRSQLAASLGRELPIEPAAPETADKGPDLLHADAHLGDAWIQRLLALARTPGAPTVPSKPSFEAAKQLTDKLAKALKTAGRSREAAEIKDLRDRFLARRDKLAWAQVKERFAEGGLSEKAYRSIKQEGADPVKLLARLAARGGPDLSAMGAQRLREHLLGR